VSTTVKASNGIRVNNFTARELVFLLEACGLAPPMADIDPSSSELKTGKGKGL
jgi:hypothetical protein